MPTPYWERHERPAPVLVRLSGGTVPLDPVMAEWETEWPDPPPWRPWELETGEFPAIIDAMGRLST